MSVLTGIKPENVFGFFETISSIPRGSGHTEKISQYCVDFAAQRGLECICDKLGDIIIFKDGTNGRENEEPVILQGHLDMVWEKNSDSDFDFLNCGLELMTDGEYVFANGTTLGGDDGVAVAICLALLDSKDVSHPPLEVIFTIDEETGMDGAQFIDVSPLKGKRMINLDSEAENVLWVSCAGGARTDIALSVRSESNNIDAYRLKITGLHGGHSGAEIHNGYANATVLMGRILKSINDKFDIYISSVTGGKMDNAITREAECVICTADSIEEEIKNAEFEIGKELNEADSEMKIILEKSVSDNRYDRESTDTLVSLLSSLPFGVIKMSSEIEGLVQTSLNPGTLSSDGEKVDIGFSVRSSVDAERDGLIDMLGTLAKEHSASVSSYGTYPAWEYRKDSPLRDSIAEVYEKIYGTKPEITAIHAGLECGLFSNKIKGLDCVSLGPDMLDIHTPDEKLSIASTGRIWELLVNVLDVI